MKAADTRPESVSQARFSTKESTSIVGHARAMYQFTATDDSAIDLQVSYYHLYSAFLQSQIEDVIDLVQCDPSSAWWEGIVRGRRGLIPRDYVEMITATANSQKALVGLWKNMSCLTFASVWRRSLR
jgi:hypothetical protein